MDMDEAFKPPPMKYGNETPAQAIVAKTVVRDLTDDQLRQMAREKLSELLQAIDAKTAPSLLLSVAREVLDRLEGKPTQRIEQKVEHSSKGRAGEMTNEQLLMQLQAAQSGGLLPAGVKLLGGDLVVDAEYTDLGVAPTKDQ